MKDVEYIDQCPIYQTPIVTGPRTVWSCERKPEDRPADELPHVVKTDRCAAVEVMAETMKGIDPDYRHQWALCAYTMTQGGFLRTKVERWGHIEGEARNAIGWWEDA